MKYETQEITDHIKHLVSPHYPDGIFESAWDWVHEYWPEDDLYHKTAKAMYFACFVDDPEKVEEQTTPGLYYGTTHPVSFISNILNPKASTPENSNAIITLKLGPHKAEGIFLLCSHIGAGWKPTSPRENKEEYRHELLIRMGEPDAETTLEFKGQFIEHLASVLRQLTLYGCIIES